MTGALTRFGQQRRSASRRPGITPGRRFALGLALALVSLGGAAASAAADSTVVSATVYQGSSGSVISPSVTLSTLESNCPLYSGTSPMYLYPGGQPYQPATNSSWALSTVLTCGLQIPINTVTSVQVYNPPPSTKGFELPLTSAQLTDPSQFQDPQAPQALPVISHDGSEDQTTYARPYLGGADNNSSDQVITSGPVALVVYENGSPLQVTAASHTVSHTATTMSVAFSATVRGSDGAAVPASDLTWSWSFGDSATSTDPSPTHSYTPGAYFVTVQVTDASAGLGGTATISVSAPTAPAAGPTSHHGSGNNKKAKSPTGTKHGNGTKPGGPTRKQTATKPRTSGQGNQPAGNSTGTSQPTGTTTPAGTGTSGTTAPTVTPSPPSTRQPPPRPRPAPHAPRSLRRPHKPTPSTGTQARLVTGLLISNVTPLPSGSSPLVHTVAASATAPAVRRAVAGSSSLAAIGAGLAVVLLLGLGAGRELGWHRGWPGWRPRRTLGLGR